MAEPRYEYRITGSPDGGYHDTRGLISPKELLPEVAEERFAAYQLQVMSDNFLSPAYRTKHLNAVKLQRRELNEWEDVDL